MQHLCHVVMMKSIFQELIPTSLLYGGFFHFYFTAKYGPGCCGFPHTTSTHQASLLSLISTSLGCQEPSLVPHSLSCLAEHQIRLATMALTRKKR
jgi:hypothetical protein